MGVAFDLRPIGNSENQMETEPDDRWHPTARNALYYEAETALQPCAVNKTTLQR